MENSNNLVHIHEVLDLVYNSGRTFTIQQLEQEMANLYGEDVLFTTCGDFAFPISGAVPFMVERNKIVLNGDIIVPAGNMCQH